MKIEYKVNWKLYKECINTSVITRMAGILDCGCCQQIELRISIQGLAVVQL